MNDEVGALDVPFSYLPALGPRVTLGKVWVQDVSRRLFSLDGAAQFIRHETYIKLK